MGMAMDARALFSDRMSVSFLLALLIHAAVLLGVSFVLDIKPLTRAIETLDVVLVNFRSETRPEEADFLAQASQLGGGEEEEPRKPSREVASDIPSVSEGDMPASSVETLPQPSTDSREQVVSERHDALPVQQITRIEQPEPPVPSAADLMQQSMQLARLQPELEKRDQWHSKLPRRRFISANTREYEFATYMQAWVAKVERVGNLNYPTDLKRRNISGDLLMTVGINLDGSVESINIRRGSGIPELDQAARRIVRLAAPYSPLPAEISEKVDVLHITRTWRFSTGNRFE